MNPTYQKGVLGGTFDLLHIGHEHFLETAFANAHFVVIGITTDTFNLKRNKITFENQHIRKNNLENFLKTHFSHKRFEVVFINDIFGTTLQDSDLQVILATKDSQANAQQIVKERDNLGLSKLNTIVVQHLRDENGEIISSTRIRNGTIDQKGRIYKNLLLKLAGQDLNKDFLAKVKLPFGELVSDLNTIHSSDILIAVGDITVQTLQTLNIPLTLSIVDFKTERVQVFNSLLELGFATNSPDFTAENPPGMISQSLVEAISLALAKKSENQVILVQGEEDLAVTPAILLAPLGTSVLYGQPKQGLVRVEVTPNLKDDLIRLLSL